MSVIFQSFHFYISLFRDLDIVPNANLGRFGQISAGFGTLSFEAATFEVFFIFFISAIVSFSFFHFNSSSPCSLAISDFFFYLCCTAFFASLLVSFSRLFFFYFQRMILRRVSSALAAYFREKFSKEEGGFIYEIYDFIRQNLSSDITTGQINGSDDGVIGYANAVIKFVFFL